MSTPLLPVKELWIIEASGKAKTLYEALRRLGIEARVFATKGHLLSFPDKLTPLGINESMHEVDRTAKDPERVMRLRTEAAAAARVVIATDADPEGDVIAWDVADILSDIHPNPLRVRLRGMDDEGILQAADEGGPVRIEDAIPGRTRAIVDRLIGATFSTRGVAVGRVGTAILGMFRDGMPALTTHRLRLCAPARDNGKPWIADTAVTLPMNAEMAERLRELVLPRLTTANSVEVVRPPSHTGQILSRAADVMGLSPKETMDAMQRNYMSGRMSYPRSGGNALSEAASARISDMIAKANQRFDPELLPRKTGADVHDAPHPLGPAPNLAHNPARVDIDEGVRILVAGDLVRAGQSQVVETPDLGPLEDFLRSRGFPDIVVEMVLSLKWKREKGPRYPGQESWLQGETYERHPAAVLTDRLLEEGLGRPSTWASHVDGFLSRGLVDDSLSLTDKGRQWIAGSPPLLLEPRMSAAIERACERGDMAKPGPGELPWEALARTIVGKLPPAIRTPLEEAASLHEVKTRPDPWAGLRNPVTPTLEGMDPDMLDPDMSHAPAPSAAMFGDDH